MKLTLIVMTYNRPVYLSRLLGFLHQQQISCEIIIGDSSLEEHKPGYEKILAVFGLNLNIKYFYFEPKTYPCDKAFELLKQVRTPYVVFCADDDFIVPNAIYQCVDFLEEHPDFAAAHGFYDGHSIIKSKETGNYKIEFSLEYSDQSIMDDSSAVRFGQHLHHYSASFYAVHRTAWMLESFDQMMAAIPNDRIHFTFQEILQSSLTIIRGKIIRLPIIYYSRSRTSPTPGWEHAILRKDFSEKYQSFKKCLSKTLSSQNKIPLDDMASFVDECFLRYLFPGLCTRPSKHPFYLKNQSLIELDRTPIPSESLVKLDESRKGKEVMGWMERFIIQFPEEVNENNNSSSGYWDSSDVHH